MVDGFQASVAITTESPLRSLTKGTKDLGELDNCVPSSTAQLHSQEHLILKSSGVW